MPVLMLKCDANFHVYLILYKTYCLAPKFVSIKTKSKKLYFNLNLFCDFFFLSPTFVLN